MIKHSPAPWVAEENVIKQQLNEINKYDRDIGHMYNGKLGNDNARYIVNAVNCHEELLQAAKDITYAFYNDEPKDYHDRKGSYYGHIRKLYLNTLLRLEKAIEKAESEGANV